MFHNSPASFGLRKFLLAKPAMHSGAIPMALSATEMPDNIKSEEVSALKITANPDIAVQDGTIHTVTKGNIAASKFEEMKKQWRSHMRVRNEKWVAYFSQQLNPIHDEGVWSWRSDHRKPNHMTLEDWQTFQEESGEEHLSLTDLTEELCTRMWEKNCSHENRYIFKEFDFA